jgi:hypothetical protein
MKTKIILVALAIVAIASLSATRSGKQTAVVDQSSAVANAPIGGIASDDK